jgi:glycosyltransferase involved in cell wall biosynthesis
MADSPLVSFVVVTHDRQPKLVRERIIQSILRQTYPRKELVLVGESCPHLGDLAAGLDGCPGLVAFRSIGLERPEEPRCVWELVSRARNAGIGLAEGTYICCQDDDNELVPEFTEAMLGVLQRTGAAAAWSYRRAVEADGTPFSGDYFPWMIGDEDRRRLLYRIWVAAGIITPGDDVIRDTLWASRGSERFCTVDPNEWLVHRDVHRRIPYREHYSHMALAYHITFDDLWNVDLCASGLPVACWQHPGLIYHLGGVSNSAPPRAAP